MNAGPLLTSVVAALAEVRLEAILIGNAAAAIQGAPVTTIDFDFLFRRTRTNLKKLKAIASELEAVLFRPYYPTAGLLRMMSEDETLQVDFMDVVSGLR